MLKLTSPDLLFKKQRVFVNLTDAEKLSGAGINNDAIKAVVLYQSAEKQLNSSQTEMLGKIMAACKFQPNQVQYINTTYTPAALGSLLSTFSSVNVILMFGSVKIGKNLPSFVDNSPVELNGVNILQTVTLDKLEAVPAEKKKLWGVLQKVLGL